MKLSTYRVFLITMKVLDARRRGATTEVYVKGIRHKAQGTRGKKPFIISLSHAPWALRPNYTPQGGAIEGNAALRLPVVRISLYNRPLRAMSLSNGRYCLHGDQGFSIPIDRNRPAAI